MFWVCIFFFFPFIILFFYYYPIMPIKNPKLVQVHNSLSHACVSPHLNPSPAKRVPIQNKRTPFSFFHPNPTTEIAFSPPPSYWFLASASLYKYRPAQHKERDRKGEEKPESHNTWKENKDINTEETNGKHRGRA